MLHIGVLGMLLMHRGNGENLLFESSKARALLVYLAVESGRSHSRETIASMLWPDRTDSASLMNLRHTLASLRTTLGERDPYQDQQKQSFFNVTSNTIQVNPDSGLCVDLLEFNRLLAAAEQEQANDPRAGLLHLNQAIQLYRGSFMEGFSLKGSPEFDDWMLLHRENASINLQKALNVLADGQIAVGDWAEALVALRRLLQLDPWNESIHRKVMTLLASQNQRSAALSQFDRCRKTLLDELGIAPEEETIQLYEQIKAGVLTGQNSQERNDKRIRQLIPARGPERDHRKPL